MGWGVGRLPVTSPHLVPDDHSGWATIPAHDYGESWVLDAVCSCGMRWRTMAGRRAWTKRRGAVRADYDQHRRRGHCVHVRIVKHELHNSKMVAAHVVTFLLSALDHIA
jgi:hypothetical protein